MPSKPTLSKREIAKAIKARSGGNLDENLAHHTEMLERLRQNRERFKLVFGHGPGSKNPRSPPKRDALADRDIFFEIQRSLMAGATVQLTATAGASVIRRRIPVYEREWEFISKEDDASRRNHKRIGQWVKTFWTPHWSRTGDMLKVFAWAMCLHEDGGYAFTLRLGPEILSKIQPARLAAHMRDRITRELRKDFGALDLEPPDFCFAIEATELGEVHIHGAATMGAVKSPLFKFTRDPLRAALKRAGGKWVGPSGKPSGRQLDAPQLNTPVKWLSYCSKWRLGSAERLKGPVFAASTGMRAAAKDWYEFTRSSGTHIRPQGAWEEDDLLDLGP